MSAPTGPLSLHDGGAASVKKAPAPTALTSGIQMSGGCGFVKSGDGDSTFVCEEQ